MQFQDNKSRATMLPSSSQEDKLSFKTKFTILSYKNKKQKNTKILNIEPISGKNSVSMCLRAWCLCFAQNTHICFHNKVKRWQLAGGLKERFHVRALCKGRLNIQSRPWENKWGPLRSALFSTVGLVPRGPHTHRMPRGSPDGAPSPSARCRGCGSQGQLPPDPRAPPRRAAARLSRGPLHHQDAPECCAPRPQRPGAAGAAAAKLGLSRPPGAASPTFSGQEGGRPRAFPVVQLKPAETSLHSYSLGCQRPGPKFSHGQGGRRAARARAPLGRTPSPRRAPGRRARPPEDAPGRGREPRALPAKPSRAAAALPAAPRGRRLHPLISRVRKRHAFPGAERKHFPCASFLAEFWM